MQERPRPADSEGVSVTPGTAVAEIIRVVIDKTDNGFLSIGVEKTGTNKFSLTARISFPPDTDIRISDEGLKYAQLLVPQF